jgi:methylamine dehydrogenase accessory protein MauD
MDLMVFAVAALWVLVMVLVVMVFALARQVGVLYERVAPAGALMINQQLKVGDAAPQAVVKSITGRELKIGAATDTGQLLFFLAPDCPVCKSLLPVLKTMHRSERGREILLLSDGDNEDEHRRFVSSEQLEQFDYALSEFVGRSYGVSKLPYGVLVNSAGLISSMGIVNSREHLESLFEAERMDVASIQDYLQQAVDADATGVKQYDSTRR